MSCLCPRSELQSFLVEITSIILAKKDDKAPGFVVDKIVDQTGSKGTGKGSGRDSGGLAGEDRCSVIQLHGPSSTIMYQPALPTLPGKWTVQQAADLSVAAPTITSSLDGRYMSALKPERVEAAKVWEWRGDAGLMGRF